MEITFEQLPKAVTQLYSKLENIERLLLEKSKEHQPEADQLLTIQQAAEILCLSAPLFTVWYNVLEYPFANVESVYIFLNWKLQTGLRQGEKKR